MNPKLKELIDYGYEFRISDYVSEGIDIFKKHAGSFIGYTLLLLVIQGVVTSIPRIGNFGSMLISPALNVGIYLFAHRVANGENPDFNTFFRGFDHFVQLLLASIVTGIITVIAALPLVGGAIYAMLSIFEGGGSLGSFPMWTIVFVIPLIYLAVCYMWTSMFIVFHHMEFWPAMEASRKIIAKNWFQVFLLALLIFFFGQILGALALIVGLLVTIPAAMCINYAAFADVTGLNEVQETDIIDHLVD